MTRRRTIATAAFLVGALGLSACGTNRQEEPGAAGGGSDCDTSKGSLIVGMIAPLSGGLSAFGVGMRNSADLAITQANEACTVPGYELVLQAEDDQATPQVGAQAATLLASDPNVVGVVGTLNSSTAQTAQPILAERTIVQVSPANTGPALTVGENFDAPQRPFDSYFRTSTTDLVQGPFAANHLVQTAGKQRIAVIDDGKTYGQNLADQFATQAEALGAQIVARERVGERDTDFSGVITAIRPQNPDAVYYGGEYPVAGPLSAQIAQAGLDIPLMGGDGINDPEFVALGGRAGDLATAIGAPAESLPSAASFVSDYEAGGYPEPFATYGALTYDATNVLVDALASTLAEGDYSEERRSDIVAAVQATAMEGATGPVAFDEYGDTTNKVLTVYTVEGSDLVPVEGSTGSFES